MLGIVIIIDRHAERGIIRDDSGMSITSCAETWRSGWIFRSFVWALRSPLNLEGASESAAAR